MDRSLGLAQEVRVWREIEELHHSRHQCLTAITVVNILRLRNHSISRPSKLLILRKHVSHRNCSCPQMRSSLCRTACGFVLV